MDLSSVVASGFVRSFPYRLVQLRGQAVGQVPEGLVEGFEELVETGEVSIQQQELCVASMSSGEWLFIRNQKPLVAPGKGQARGQELAHRPGSR